MNIRITSRNTAVRDEFRERCEKKIKKFDRFFGESADAVVTVSNQNGRETVEVTITSGGMLFRAEKTTSDRMDSLEAVSDALTKQITRNKTRLETKFRTGTFQPSFNDEVTPEDYGVVRIKHFPLKPMNVQEAILQMNMLDHSFFMFRNEETDEINVVYRRNDENYGLLEPGN
ncbi:MAG TPA: ribosome-associated translation inhibitor RaiA [Oscillospiraceae bacterium]|nr:ribosome-associated translation inhibitor RaiA [Oscillospiraceae bacterium]HXK78073.1 ribosome-associated translation inhibitor RaiA [Oscillospiraceae bacterium]